MSALMHVKPVAPRSRAPFALGAAVVAAVVRGHGLAGCTGGRFSATVLVGRGGGQGGCGALLLLPHHDVSVAARELADRVVGVLPGLPAMGQAATGWYRRTTWSLRSVVPLFSPRVTGLVSPSCSTAQ